MRIAIKRAPQVGGEVEAQDRPKGVSTRLPARARAGGALRRYTTRWGPATLAILGGALVLWLIAGVGFVNYDTLYALVWGQQITRGETPEYGLPIAPTPHPLIEVLGIPLAPLGASAESTIVVALAFLALSACGWVIYRLGEAWFGRAAGIVAALVFLTRVPVLSYGVRAYVDVPYTLLVLSALLVETRHRRAGAPVLVLLGLAGLLRPEAWVFSGIYWVLLVVASERSRAQAALGASAPVGPAMDPAVGPAMDPAVEPAMDPAVEPAVEPAINPAVEPAQDPARSRRDLARLALLAAAAPLFWIASDLAVTGNAMWSLTNTKHTAATLGRATGIGDVPQYIPRRIGEILRPAVLAGAAFGGVLSLLWLRDKARLGAIAGVVAVLVFALMATFGLPIDTRYAFLASAILCLFCGAGAFGWIALAKDDRRRTPWMVAGSLVLVALLATLPGQIKSAHKELSNLAHQESIQSDLLALVKSKAVSPTCGPVGVPNHAPVPLLALYLKSRPGLVVSAEAKQIQAGTYVDPASLEVERDYILDPKDPHAAVSIPPGFTATQSNRSWLIFQKCA
ncbi:MAG: hypothetical protein WB998_07340 [Solirubrobacteraceae bacterium]